MGEIRIGIPASERGHGFIDLAPYADQIEKLAGVGLNLQQIAQVLDVSDETIRKRMHESPEIALALKKGRAKAYANVAKTAYELATSGTEPAMTMFWLKCQAKWREREPETVNLSLVLNRYGAEKLEDLGTGEIVEVMRQIAGGTEDGFNEERAPRALPRDPK